MQTKGASDAGERMEGSESEVERGSEGSIHRVDTVPPPEGGSAYGAETVVRAVDPEILAAIKEREKGQAARETQNVKVTGTANPLAPARAPSFPGLPPPSSPSPASSDARPSTLPKRGELPFLGSRSADDDDSEQREGSEESGQSPHARIDANESSAEPSSLGLLSLVAAKDRIDPNASTEQAGEPDEDELTRLRATPGSPIVSPLAPIELGPVAASTTSPASGLSPFAGRMIAIIALVVIATGALVWMALR